MSSQSAAPAAIPPQGIVMQMVMGGWIARAISEITRSQVPEVLEARGPMSAAELVASGVEANPTALERLLRACASVGLFTESADGRFGPTPLSAVLTAGSPVSVKVLAQEAGSTWLRMWGELRSGLLTGEPQADKVFGMGWWDYLNANPAELETFGEAMKSNSLNSMRGVLDYCDLSSVTKVADIGGGFGHLVVGLLQKYPSLRGVLLDIPELIPVAKERFPLTDASVASRLEYVGGNMFAGVPSADAYILKHIIHDWDDEHCVRLIKNIHAAMDGKGRLVCVDAVLPPMGDASAPSAKLLDILMLLAIRGKERTLKEWEALYEECGFRVTRVTPLHDNFGTSIVEGEKI